MQSAHALIIDDNANNIAVLATLLEQQGLTTTSVSSLRLMSTALDETPKVDIIFLDLEFPNGDGFDTFRSLKADPRLVKVPVVAYSVHISEIDRARREGFQGFLGKPLDAKRFPAQLERLLSGIPVWEM